MYIDRGIIETFFLRIPAEVVIDLICGENNINFLDDKNIREFEHIFIQHLIEVFPTFSEDERQQAFNIIVERLNKNNQVGIFSLLEEFNENVLVEYNYKVYCRFHQLMRWRMLSHKLDQDLFITSFFAKNDFISRRIRNKFTWDLVIRTDNTRLHNMLSKGMAENHFHLKGSAPYFDLVWVSLMNRISGRSREFELVGISENRLNGEMIFKENSKRDSIENLVYKAAIIRIFLFSKLMEYDTTYSKYMKHTEDKENLLDYDNIKKILKLTSEEMKLKLREYNSIISVMRYITGYKFENKKVDYAIVNGVFRKENNDIFKLFLFGERWLIYSFIKKIYENKVFKNYEMLLYLYILIKNKFRAELVQINNRYGFKNFSDYQDRKTIFLKKDPLLDKAIYYMAMETTRKDQNILKLEARICPWDTANGTNAQVKEIDRIINSINNEDYYEGNGDKFINYINNIRGKNNLNNDYTEENKKYFYVIHIPKRVDEESKEIIEKNQRFFLPIRDWRIRENAKDCIYQIMELREKKRYASRKILGIDGCGNEIGCRPEVFAQAFRALKAHTQSSDIDIIKDLYLGDKNFNLPLIKVTYHVGEDFLDVADGLRAIDEAIKFLNLSHGERLGHAIALGINVREWYNVKFNNIILSRQDYLDNIAWMLNKVHEYKIPVNIFMLDELEKEFLEQYTYIYYKDTYENNINYKTYYDSWLLRGDDPQLYLNGEYNENNKIRFWDRCAINRNINKEIRKNRLACNLYYQYHYDFDVRKKGYETINKKVTENYIEIVSLIQKEMQKDIRKLGIGIETNPSSNYLISTFKRYDKHPIINFFNLGLENDNNKIKECPQLFVSINTDDQGVFGTYLENEYALMAIALEKAKDEKGNPKYNQEMIYDWLDRIREMGLQQSFLNGSY